jgi:hypothetical protein
VKREPVVEGWPAFDAPLLREIAAAFQRPKPSSSALLSGRTRELRWITSSELVLLTLVNEE